MSADIVGFARPGRAVRVVAMGYGSARKLESVGRVGKSGDGTKEVARVWVVFKTHSHIFKIFGNFFT